MHVLATAGHVDHGKSTLVRALTGMEPDRWKEERRRGLTLDLGFCWTQLPGVGDVAFVDVPGHERFVSTMLAGVGAVPAVLFVVAADEGWMPQSEEHLAALDAFAVRHGVLAVTRADLADPAPVLSAARQRIARTTLGAVPAVGVSGATGHGLDALRAALRDVVAAMPVPDEAADVRLWVDRSFTIRGAGTVVTGTLPAGTVRVGDELTLAGSDRTVTARGVQTLGRPTDRAVGVSRVALNLRGIDRTDVRRGDALVNPAAWSVSDLVDVHVVGADARALPMRLVLHIGSASLGASVRPLGERAARLALDHALPLRIGDRALLRDPGAHRIPAAVLVADLTPPALRRRGDARRRAEFLGGPGGALDGAGELRRRGVVSGPGLRRAGVSPPVPPVIVDWYVDPDLLPRLQERLRVTVEDYRTQHPLESGPPLETVRQALDVPDARVVEALLTPPHALNAGRIVSAGSVSELPPGVAASVAVLEQELAAATFVAPDAPHLAALGLGPREVAAAVRAGRLLKLADGVVLLPRAEIAAVERLATLPQPFTVAAARQALDTSRRVAVPLLELLDRHKLTRRLPDDRREVVADVRDLRRT